jgi:hypothetical protein
MGRTVEESVLNAMLGAFSAQVARPSKAYIAMGTKVPQVGEHFHCKRFEANTNCALKTCATETSTVQGVLELSSNVFCVITRNSYYFTRISGMPVGNVHFAVIKQAPQIGAEMYCNKVEFKGEAVRCVKWHTTTVQEIKYINGLYKVTTNNSVYMCFKL